MKITILKAAMSHAEEDGYQGRVVFAAEGHKEPYEVTIHRKKKGVWDYSLSFEKDPGGEEDIAAVEIALEENDELFDQIVDAAMNSMPARTPSDAPHDGN